MRAAAINRARSRRAQMQSEINERWAWKCRQLGATIAVVNLGPRSGSYSGLYTWTDTGEAAITLNQWTPHLRLDLEIATRLDELAEVRAGRKKPLDVPALLRAQME